MGHTASRPDEPALLERVRVGEDEAFGELFEIHVAAVRRLARGLASDPSEADDITAETFFRVLQAVRRGNGPRDNVRAYLLTVARRVAWEWHGSRRDVPVTDDELTTRAGTGSDSQTRTAEATLITRAFSSLPERWRTVLWQTEVEGEQPAVVAPHFGLSANATAALARRARLGLRAAYLQAHLATNRGADGCRTVMEKLGGYTAGCVTGAEARRVEAHLRLCDSCRSMHGELLDVCSSLRAHAGVVMLLVPAAGLAWGTTAGVGAGTVSATAVGGAAGAGGASAGGGLGGTVVTLGAHVKVGLALASTAAVGTVGFATAPLLDGYREAMDLPGDGVMRLEIAESRSDDPVPARMGPGTGLIRADAAVPMHAEAGPRTVVIEPARHQQVLEYSLPSQQVPRRPAASDESRRQTTLPSQVDGSTPPQATPDRDGGQGGKQRGDAGGVSPTPTTTSASTSSPTSAPATPSTTTPTTTDAPGNGPPDSAGPASETPASGEAMSGSGARPAAPANARWKRGASHGARGTAHAVSRRTKTSRVLDHHGSVS